MYDKICLDPGPEAGVLELGKICREQFGKACNVLVSWLGCWVKSPYTGASGEIGKLRG